MNGKRPARLALGFIDDIAIAAAEEHQRRCRPVACGVANDADHEDDMIAAVIIAEGCTFEMSQRARDQRRFSVAYRYSDLVPFVGKRAGELIGDALLIAGKDVDGK